MRPGLIVLKVGCGTSIPIYVGLGLEGGGWENDGMDWWEERKERKWAGCREGGMGGQGEEVFTIVGQMDSCLEGEVTYTEWRMERKKQRYEANILLIHSTIKQLRDGNISFSKYGTLIFGEDIKSKMCWRKKSKILHISLSSSKNCSGMKIKIDPLLVS